MIKTFKATSVAAPLLGLVLLGSAGKSSAQTVVFEDSFDGAPGTAVDGTKWTVSSNSHGLDRARFGLAPTLASENGVSFARLRLDTYNADQPGVSFKGTEMYSKAAFGLGNGGKEIEARVRSPFFARGLVSAFFLYGDDAVHPERSSDEIDVEFLGNFSTSDLLLTSWNDWNFSLGYGQGASHWGERATVAGLNWSGWNTYKIRWEVNSVRWFVNDVLVRTNWAPNMAVPQDPQQLFFNFWVPNSGWTDAYDAALSPTANASQNISYLFDVDWVKVSSLADTTSPLPPTFSSPLDNAVATAMPSASGTAQDNVGGSGLSRVDLVITRASDNARWNGSTWVNYETGVRAVLSNNSWSVTSGLPSGADLADGLYTLKAVDFDVAGNANASQISIRIDKTAPSAPTVSAPVANSAVNTLVNIRGAASDSGSGVASVSLQIRRTVNGAAQYWNGTGWGAPAASLSAALSGGAWSYAGPSGAALSPSGAYTITTWSHDRAGNRSADAYTNCSVDTLAPTPSFNTPTNGARVWRLNSNGFAPDNSGGSGLSRVDLVITRASDGLRWNGSTWVGFETGLRAEMSGTLWAVGTGLPTGASLPNGTYTLKAVAYDRAGNVGGASINVNVVK